MIFICLGNGAMPSGENDVCGSVTMISTTYKLKNMPVPGGN